MHLTWMNDHVYGLSPTSLGLAIAALLVAVLYYSLKNNGLPPGPTGVPFLGYWPFLDPKNSHLQFDAFKKKYGDVFSINVTGTTYINLGTSKAVREAHITKSDCFAKRLEVFSLMTEMFEGGVAFLNSEEWKVNRKFFLQVLKERVSLSVKDILSGSLYDSVNSTVDELRKKKTGETVNIVEFLTSKCNANLRLTFFGETGISEESVRVINESYAVMMAGFTATNLLASGNIAKYIILPFTPGYKQCIEHLRKVEKIIYKIIDEHKSTYDEEHIRDIIDDYIKERSERRSKGDPTAQYFTGMTDKTLTHSHKAAKNGIMVFYGKFGVLADPQRALALVVTDTLRVVTDKALMSSLVQIIGDGVLSVAAFIALFLKSVLDNPEEQEKLYMELVEVVGVDRQPTIDDKSKLTYTNAFIQEALRTTDFFPFFPSMECTKETTIHGYRIPKGSISLMNIYSAHNDPKSYEEPEKFNPSRFIVTEGKRKPEPLVTFGVGKRACIGESFTMLQVFLFVATLIKNFHISLPEDIKESSFELLMTGRLKLLLDPRN